MRTLCLAATLTALLFGTGCQRQIKVTDEKVTIIQHFELVEMQKEQGDGLLLVDVRPPDQFAEYHIPGARNVPIATIVESDPRLADAKSIVLYDIGWQRDRVSLAQATAKKLIALRYRNVYAFLGGIKQWVASGGKLVNAKGETVDWEKVKPRDAR